MTNRNEEVKLSADVLVIGGGPAGTWAALTAAEKGCSVVLVDKGYCGTSGATAPSGTSILYVNPEPELREQARLGREALGGHLAERRWVQRILERTYENVNRLADWGYPFPTVYEGYAYRCQLQGPEYMRLMRRLVLKAGVKILDHSPALELLADGDGIGGARGTQTQSGKDWKVTAGGVVIASGGCAFLSKALGCNVLTGDGYLLGAEAGAELSGMEFSNHYSLCAAFSSVTKTRFFSYATFTYQDGTPVEGAGSRKGRSILAKTLMTQPVYARLDKVEEYMKGWMRKAQPNFFLPFDRCGIDPYTDRFPITLRLEGTVRGTGGINILADDCATSVPGLYAAGDAATREFLCGGFTGGGSHNAAWAMSSGHWAGEGAAHHAKRLSTKLFHRDLQPVWLSPAQETKAEAAALSSQEIIKAVQNEVMPYDLNIFRNKEKLEGSLRRLKEVWEQAKGNISAAIDARSRVRAKEAQAMTATARWMYASALARDETRGMHKREDFPELNEQMRYRLLTGGLDETWVKPHVAKDDFPEVRHDRAA